MPIIEDIQDYDTLVIAITGFAFKLNMPVERFFEKAGLKETSKIIITDPSRLKTLAGLPPDFQTFDEMLKHLKEVISKSSHKHLIITGTSGGAHTALLLGHLLQANQAVAFSPYPYLSLEQIKKMGDPALVSMRRAVARFNNLNKDIHKYFDLKDLLSKWNGVTDYYVHVSRYNTWDYRRAVYLESCPHTNIIAHPYSEHAVASIIAREDKLANCFVFPYRKDNNGFTLVWNAKMKSPN